VRNVVQKIGGGRDEVEREYQAEKEEEED